ncbi:MAG TPA: manganese efflux pump MntP family protein [Hyphomonadaceae bacterium]|jgi:putative Mn2+ efflux pump MntP|nr:manganese efflux pump MntP family protein [Hyphomonadaceae bacterium]
MPVSLILLAFGLAADAFAVSITQGAAAKVHPWRTAITVSLAFGVAQAVAPLLGWSLGVAFAGLIEAWDHWIAFTLLALIGAKMIWEGAKPKTDEAEETKPAAGWSLLMLAVATAIDAAAAGITLPALGAPIVVSILTIGFITFATCFAGVWIGRTGSRVIGPNAEIIGGIILIVIGAKVLFDHHAFGAWLGG